MEETSKYIAILGSTGSIGCQTLDIVDEYSEKLKIEVLTANENYNLLIQQALKYNPNAVVIGNENYYKDVSAALSQTDIKVYAGADSISQIVQLETIDIVLNALVGYSGFLPTINAIKSDKTIALANKETLVVGGELISRLIARHRSQILPVDSEHSAIFQCLVGEDQDAVEKIYLTASGGPFLNKKAEELEKVTKEEALKHPNWSMGEKITIDSATLMNKGLEVIEARWLFGLKLDQIDVIIHPQSIIHSMVQFSDGSIKAQMNLPDMKGPIQYALFYPNRTKSNSKRFNFTKHPNLTFEKPDLKKFRNLALAYQALGKGGNVPCIMNAANEVVVDAFLKGKIGFLEMPDIIEKCMDEVHFIPKPNFADYVISDQEARVRANNYLKS